MQLKTAERIVQAAKFNSIEARLHQDYSGRGMMGRTTHAVIVNNHTALIRAVAWAVVLVGSDQGETSDLVNDLNFRFDNMGHDLIAY